jgi:hypothetical protein
VNASCPAGLRSHARRGYSSGHNPGPDRGRDLPAENGDSVDHGNGGGHRARHRHRAQSHGSARG